MLNIFLAFLLVLQGPMAFAKKKKPAPKFPPITHYEAAAMVNTMKNVNTYNGFLTWFSQYAPKDEINNLRKVFAKYGINESDFIPEFTAKGNRVSKGGTILEIHEKYVKVNNRKFTFDGSSPSQYIEKICSKFQCGTKEKYSLIEDMVFPKAEALANFWIFAIGVGVGVLGTLLWQRWRRKRYGVPTVAGVPVVNGSPMVVSEMTNRPPEEVYVCDGTNVYIQRVNGGNVQIFNLSGERVMISPRLLQQGATCQQQAAAIQNSVRNNNRSEATSSPPAGSRVMQGKQSGEKITEPKK